MLLTPFVYVAPESLDEALTLLKGHKDARLLAGGQSLLTEMKLRHASPSMLVALRNIQVLRGIERHHDGTLHIGAMTTFVEIAEDPDVQKRSGALVDAVKSTGDSQVRNCRTIGGTLAFNAPGADLPAAVLALDATLTIFGPQGIRTVSATAFNAEMAQGERSTAEIIQAITFPSVAIGCGSAYDKFKNQANDSALCGVATSVALAVDGTLRDCRVAVAGATRYATRLTGAEAALNGKPATVETIQAAARVAGELDCISDFAASAEYRAALTRTLTERSLTRAFARIKEMLR